LTALLGKVDQHEATAAKIARSRVRHGQRESGCDRGIYRVSTFLQDLHADAGRNRVYRHDRRIRKTDHRGRKGCLLRHRTDYR